MERGDLSGKEDRRPDRLHLRGVAAVRHPGARRTLRKLGDAGGHPAGDSLRRVGAFLGLLLRGFDNNVYTQIGLIMLVASRRKMPS
jgi:hypothetical protein